MLLLLVWLLLGWVLCVVGVVISRVGVVIVGVVIIRVGVVIVGLVIIRGGVVCCWCGFY